MINHSVIGGSEKVKLAHAAEATDHIPYSIPMHQRDAQRQERFLLHRSSVTDAHLLPTKHFSDSSNVG